MYVKRLIVLALCATMLSGCGLNKNMKANQMNQTQTTTAVYDGVGSEVENEEVVFSFITTNKKKLILSYCEEEDQFIYRFFNKEQLEIQLPDADEDAWQFFEFEDFHQVGPSSNGVTDINQLNFTNRKYRYEVYDNYDNTNRKRQVGVRVISMTDGQSYEIQGDAESAVGSLMLLYEKYPKLVHRVMGQ